MILEKLLQAIPRKSYNNFANVVVILFFFSGLALVPIAEDLDRRTVFRCSPSKEITSRLDFVQLSCHSKFAEAYQSKISLGSLVLLNFVLILAFSILYASWARFRVEKWDISTESKNTDCKRVGQWNVGGKDISLFYIYIAHLLFTRFLLLLVFALLVFYPINVPTNFSCPWRHPPSVIPCVDILARKKMTLAKVVATIDIVFAFCALAEVIYIFRWKRRNQEFSAITDTEFISVYILARRDNIGAIINNIRKSVRVDTNLFIKPVIRENKDEEYAEKTYENVQDIFKPMRNEDRSMPRRILIVGGPGMGKSALTRRILQDWQQKVEFWKGKLIIRLPFRVFNYEKNKKLNLLTLISYGSGVTQGAGVQGLQDVYQFIVLNQENVVVIFDGLHELDVDLEHCWQDEDTTRNLGADDEMSIFSLYVKLIRREFLPDVTIVTTTRRTSEELYQNLFFERKVEILGFTEAEIEKFVDTFCHNKQKLKNEIWSEIKQSTELLDICYIPVSCNIVCSTLRQSIEFEKQGTSALTMTEIYRRYVTTVLHKHHKLFRGNGKRQGYVVARMLPKELQNNILQHARIAKLALDNQWCLQFELAEDFLNLKNCGLLEKVDEKNRNVYSFPHLTIQEYLAAVYLFHDLENMSKCLGDKIKIARWHLVVQFLAGLIGNEICLLRNQTLDASSTKKKDELEKIVYDTFVQWVSPLKASEKMAKKTALLAVKCIDEIQDPDITKAAAEKLDGGGTRGFNLCNSDIAPMDCRGLFQLLIHVDSLRKLNLAENKISDQGMIELCKLLRANKFLRELDISSNLITDAGIEALCSVLTEGACSLYHLNVRNNRMTGEGFRMMCEALKDAKCMLSYLDIWLFGESFSISNVALNGHKNICEALKHENCKLTVLSIMWFGDVSELCEALRHENCKLKTLNIGYSQRHTRELLELASHVPGFLVV